MTDNINVNISSSDIDPATGEGVTTNVSISTSDTQELYRLLSLAGLTPDATDGMEISTPVVVSSDDIIDDVDDGMDDVEEIVPEQADYDYGKNPTSRKGHQLPIDPYEYEGTAREPVRYTPARMADNPLEGKTFMDYLGKVLKENNRKSK